MRLTSSEQVLLVMGIQNNSGSLENAGAALDVTSRLVENLLETQLEDHIHTDFFDYEYSRMRSRFEPQTFRLSSRFVDPSAKVVVREGTETLRTPADGTIVPASDYVIDHDKGTVTVLRDLPVGYCTVSVTYTAGFRAADGVLKGTPDWLRRLGVLAAQHYINLNPAHVSSKKLVAFSDISDALFRAVTTLANPYRRSRMDLVLPTRTLTHD